MNIKDLIKDNTVKFDSYRQGFFYYNILLKDFYEDNDRGYVTSTKYQFPVPLDDIGTSTLLREDKAITFMRWIRKSNEDGTLVKV